MRWRRLVNAEVIQIRGINAIVRRVTTVLPVFEIAFISFPVDMSNSATGVHEIVTLIGRRHWRASPEMNCAHIIGNTVFCEPLRRSAIILVIARKDTLTSIIAKQFGYGR